MVKPLNFSAKSTGKAEAIKTLNSFGIDLYEGQTVSSLPYGIRKKIEVVRALMSEPQLLLLDEPAAGLNTAETNTLRDLLKEVEAVCIAVPTLLHHEVGLNCLESKKHVLIEKPIAASQTEASELIIASNQANCLLQVGHFERFF